MASYQYLDMCYSNTVDLYSAMASSCSVTNAAGWAHLCTPTATGFTNRNYTSSTASTSVNYVPPLVNCSFDAVAPLELGWAVILAFCVAFGARLIYSRLR